MELCCSTLFNGLLFVSIEWLSAWACIVAINAVGLLLRLMASVAHRADFYSPLLGLLFDVFING